MRLLNPSAVARSADEWFFTRADVKSKWVWDGPVR